jgi:hypothetical protein
MGAVGWIVLTVTNNRRRQAIAKTQADMQAKLLDKLGGGQDTAEFLKTEAGQRLLESAGTETADPFRRILGSIQAGLVLTLLGISILFISGRVGDAEKGLTVLGTMSAAVGVGFLISSAISYALSKSWGLFEHKSSGGR